MKNGEVLLKNGHNFTELDIESYGKVSPTAVSYRIYFNDKCIDIVIIDHVSSVHAMLVWLNKEYDPKILDKVEKKYLLGVIKPFKDKVTYIAKLRNCRNNKCVICIYTHDKKENTFDTIYLPRFEVGTMYNGMQDNKKYTPEELGL